MDEPRKSSSKKDAILQAMNAALPPTEKGQFFDGTAVFENLALVMSAFRKYKLVLDADLDTEAEYLTLMAMLDELMELVDSGEVLLPKPFVQRADIAVAGSIQLARDFITKKKEKDDGSPQSDAAPGGSASGDNGAAL